MFELDNFMIDQQELESRFQKMKPLVSERKFAISDAGVAHRWITYWQEKGLLYGFYDKGKWRKFHLVDMVWLKSIIKLRKFGVPLATIKTLRDFLMNPIDERELVKDKTIREGIARFHPELSPAEIDSILDQASESPLMNTDAPELLYFIILDSLVMKSNWFLLVGADGKIGYLKLEEWNKISQLEGFNDIYYKSHVSLSINEIIAESLGGVELTFLENELQLVTPGECEILRQIRSGELQTLTIHFGKSQTPELIEATRVKKVEVEARVMEIILSGGYQKLELKNVNGKIVYCEDTIQTKL